MYRFNGDRKKLKANTTIGFFDGVYLINTQIDELTTLFAFQYWSA